MRRFDLSASHRTVIDRSPADVWAFLEDLDVALRAFPGVGAAVALEPRGHYAVELGPFGVGSFRGTVRLAVRAARTRRTLAIESLPECGNTDLRATIEVEPAEGPGGAAWSRLHVEIWASPRKDVPAFLPIGFVQSVARRTVERGLADGADRMRRVLAGDLQVAAAPAAV